MFDAQQECFMEVGSGRLYMKGREKKRDCNVLEKELEEEEERGKMVIPHVSNLIKGKKSHFKSY